MMKIADVHRILVYKRTHLNDPENGRFGSHDCMGRVRDFDYDAVIGVGGIGAHPQSLEISGKITWIGIGPQRRKDSSKRASVVTLERYHDFSSEGAELKRLAPLLTYRVFDKKARYVIVKRGDAEFGEVLELLQLASRPTGPKRKIKSQLILCKPTRNRATICKKCPD